jgi:hypothetical protein
MNPGHVAARLVEPVDEAELDRIAAAREYDGDRRRRRLGRQRRRITPARHYDGNAAVDQLGRQGGKPIVATLRPAEFDRDVLALDVAGFLQTLAEDSHEVRIGSGRSAMQVPDHGQRQLLGGGGGRPRDRRRRHAREQRDELPSPDVEHWIVLPAALALAVAAFGATIGDNIGYWLGSRYGYTLLLRYGER